MPATGLPKGEMVDYLTRAKKRLVEKFKPRNTHNDEKWKRRRNEREPYVPEAARGTTQEFHAPFVRDLARRSQAIIGDRPPTPKVIPLKVGPEAQRNADKKELWLMAERERTLQREDWWGMGTDAFAHDAEVIFKKTVHLKDWGKGQDDDEDDDGFNKRTEDVRRKHFPFRVEQIPTNSFYPIAYDDDGLCEVMIVTKREAFEMADLYDLRYDKAKGKLTKAVGDVVDDDFPNSAEHVEWWNRTHFCTMVDGEIVQEPQEHDYEGWCPFFHAQFSTTSSKDPGFRTEGILDSILDLQDKIENFATAAEHYIWKASFPSYQPVPVSEDALPQYNQQGKTDIKLNHGGPVEGLPFGHKLEPVDLPPIGPDLKTMQDFLMTILDRVSLAPILYAQLQGDVSGPVATSLIAIAKSIFGPGLNNLARCMNRMDAFTLEMIEKRIKHPVPVWQEYEKNEDGKVVRRGSSDWEELSPEDINGYYTVQNQLAPIIPLERQQAIIQLTDGWERGLVSKRRVQEEGYGITSPEKEDEEIEVDEYTKLEMYKQWVWSKFMERIEQQAVPPVGGGTPPVPAVGPGGPVPQLAGVQQVEMPGFPGAPMMPPAMPPPDPNMPMPMPMGGAPLA